MMIKQEAEKKEYRVKTYMGNLASRDHHVVPHQLDKVLEKPPHFVTVEIQCSQLLVDREGEDKNSRSGEDEKNIQT